MNFLLTIFFFSLIISFLVFIHELGHFAAAKLSGVRVHEFAIGFGNSIFKKEYKGTLYKINLIPMGGYVQLEGEHDSESPNSFRNKNFGVKAFVLTSGVLMNLIFTILFLTVFLYTTGFRFVIPKFTAFGFTQTEFSEEYFPITVLELEENSPWKDKFELEENIIGINDKDFTGASDFYDLISDLEGSNAKFKFINLETFEVYEREEFVEYTYKGYLPTIVSDVKIGGRSDGIFKNGDVIVEINGQKYKNRDEFFKLLEASQGKNTTFTLLNEDDSLSTKTLDLGFKDENGAILDVSLVFDVLKGVGVSYDAELGRQTFFLKYKKSLFSGVFMTYDIARYQFKALGNLFADAYESGDYTEVSNSFGGLPQLGNEVNRVVSLRAFDFLIPLTAFISLSLAMFNILPIPALDGGQLALAFIETITRKKIPDSIANKINIVGFSFLIFLSQILIFTLIASSIIMFPTLAKVIFEP